MRLSSLSFFAFVVMTLASACSTSSGSGSPSIRASDYDQSCTAATDCVDVFDGPVCGCAACGGGVINLRDDTRFQEDRSALQKLCPPGGPFCPNPCDVSELTCIAGKCGVCHSLGCSGAGDAGTGDAARD